MHEIVESRRIDEAHVGRRVGAVEYTASRMGHVSAFSLLTNYVHTASRIGKAKVTVHVNLGHPCAAGGYLAEISVQAPTRAQAEVAMARVRDTYPEPLRELATSPRRRWRIGRRSLAQLSREF